MAMKSRIIIATFLLLMVAGGVLAARVLNLTGDPQDTLILPSAFTAEGRVLHNGQEVERFTYYGDGTGRLAEVRQDEMGIHYWWKLGDGTMWRLELGGQNLIYHSTGAMRLLGADYHRRLGKPEQNLFGFPAFKQVGTKPNGGDFEVWFAPDLCKDVKRIDHQGNETRVREIYDLKPGAPDPGVFVPPSLPIVYSEGVAKFHQNAGRPQEASQALSDLAAAKQKYGEFFKP
ncbi:MAG: hypothetical protein AB7U82_24215 [Blastocatellales bacterium]